MAAEERFDLRWGIMATGNIAYTFTKDLLSDPTTRGTTNVHHVVAAVASSSSAEKTRQFLDKLNLSCAGYSSYEELVADSNVDAVYVGTPHSHHFQHVMLALEEGKHVLCEKPLTVNANQAKILCEEARKRKLFLMEAVWTRYLPLTIDIVDKIRQGTIGEVLRVIADTSFGDEVEKTWGTEHRMLNKDLAGGALLDLGIYSLTWVFQCLYHTLPESQRKAPSAVAAQMTLNYLTGADEATSILLTFPTTTPNNVPEWKSQAIAMTNLRVSTDPDGKNTAGPAIRIQGTKGEIQVEGPSFRPERYHIISCSDGNAQRQPCHVEHLIPQGDRGMYWEADEVARCVKAGKLSSDGLPWDEMIAILEVMDEARRQGGLAYPESIEGTHYSAKQ
ncbi:uncharacterized protein TRUGW13939_04922 [Talaromyces rugulosus]|uniref:D-xylose 1-dehydrogenase (NADP(+), D-xylono-1,5-lactone-forming) n=1 Tax=Talaromyces rugulosus TaxID=121627 RepID=A0A7H8QUP5_TALRU|nr:uncharacterized protein TRUGW13939_04922 [Talaromyces rugulosus]QKX57802.1 hypothetical protein TRUGW13939_04922 [Talaromyces rugulosus]